MQKPHSKCRHEAGLVVGVRIHVDDDQGGEHPDASPCNDERQPVLMHLAAPHAKHEGKHHDKAEQLDVENAPDDAVHCDSLVVRVRSAPGLTNVEPYNYITNMQPGQYKGNPPLREESGGPVQRGCSATERFMSAGRYDPLIGAGC